MSRAFRYRLAWQAMHLARAEIRAGLHGAGAGRGATRAAYQRIYADLLARAEMMLLEAL